MQSVGSEHCACMNSLLCNPNPVGRKQVLFPYLGHTFFEVGDFLGAVLWYAFQQKKPFLGSWLLSKGAADSH